MAKQGEKGSGSRGESDAVEALRGIEDALNRIGDLLEDRLPHPDDATENAPHDDSEPDPNQPPLED